MNEDDDDSDTQCISFEFVVNFKYHYGWSIFVYFLMGFCIKFHAHTWTSHDWMTETEWKYGNERITNIFEKKTKNYSNELSMGTNTYTTQHHSYKRGTCNSWLWWWWRYYECIQNNTQYSDNNIVFYLSNTNCCYAVCA